MRDILFLWLLLYDGEWVEGVYFAENIEYPATIFHGERNALGDYVDHSTVGQYTGLLDKNGTRIFEGDIVSTDTKRPYLIVEFRDGCFMFNCNDGGEDYYDIMLPILKEPQTVYKYGEVIGNIHDNPELLEGGESE